MKIKLVTLWSGPLPPWFDLFKQRIEANACLDWTLIRYNCVDEVNALATVQLGTLVRKGMPYALCDLRPMLGEVLRQDLAKYEWWGWIDLDVIVGDLDRLLVPTLNGRDIITTAPDQIHGPLTLLRNAPEVNQLWRLSPNVTDMLADSEYWNYDEVGFNPNHCLDFNSNPSFTQAVIKSLTTQVKWDARCWTESHDTIEDGLPSRCVRLDGNRLIETPTERELLCYHFTTKQWPLPNRYCSSYERLVELQQSHLARKRSDESSHIQPPTKDTPESWGRRVQRVLESKELTHKMVLDCTLGDWTRIQQHSWELLNQHIQAGQSMLDCGCGYGALTEVIPGSREGNPLVRYDGVDWCPEMIRQARVLHPLSSFYRANLLTDQLPYSDTTFDWAVCRGLEGSVKSQHGNRAWNRMKAEMLRVAKRLLVIDMNRTYRVIERTP